MPASASAGSLHPITIRGPCDLSKGACPFCRAGFASRGTAITRDASATRSHPYPGPEKSWVALLVRRVEHFGSTAVPDLAAKPIVDMLVEVQYLWRPTHGHDGPPFYAWFIKGCPDTGVHIHMVEAGPQFAGHWDRLVFRDHPIDHPEVAAAYEGEDRLRGAGHARSQTLLRQGLNSHAR
jgi:hypothetical protein